MKKTPKYQLEDPNPNLQCPVCGKVTAPAQTRLMQLTAMGENNFYFGKRNYLKEAKSGTFKEWACRTCEETGAVIFPDFKKQDYGLGGPIYVYVNRVSICATCSSPFDFKPAEQQHWYEELGFNYNAYPKNCQACRKKIRTSKLLHKQLGELLNKEPKTAAVFEEIASVYEKLGIETKARIFNSRANNARKNMNTEQHIKTKLEEIAEKYRIKVLYACETGSRAWGFPSPDSDYDVRIIYMHEPDWYLSLSDKKDTLELMLDNGELDITGWDFKKCLKLLWKSNGALLERIQSPIVYQTTPGLVEQFHAYAQKCFTPAAVMHHYSGMARTSLTELDDKEELKLKKLFYALRATLACKWILEKDSIPPIVFNTMVQELDFDKGLKQRIAELVELKSGKNESYIHAAEKGLMDFIHRELAVADEQAGSLKGRKERADLDEFFRYGLKNYWE